MNCDFKFNKAARLLIILFLLFLNAADNASAHISYLGRNLGTWTSSSGNWSVSGNSGNLTSGSVSITAKNISKDYGWSKAANTDHGDSHDGGWFRLTVSGASGAFVITATGGTTNSQTRAGIYPFDNIGPRFLPAFTIYRGLAVSEAHEGALDAIGNSTLANEGGASGELIYVGHAADGTSANYGSNPDIEGDGSVDGIVKKTLTLQTGNYSIFVGGGNNGGSDIGNYGVNLAIKAAALPVITSSLNKTGTIGEGISYTITATNAPTSFGAEGLPIGLTINTSTGVISGIPSAAGNSSINITATNNDGATGSATLVISIAPPSPVINSPTSASGTVGSPFNYQITASRGPASFGAVGLPSGLSVNSTTGIISGTPTQSGLFASTISAFNGNGTGSRSLEISILPQPPVLTSTTTANGTVGSAFSYQITASGSPASYAATMLPAGLSLDPSTGAITGTPTAVGNTTITLSATNSEGTGSGNLTIRVVPARPEITSATTANGTVGSAFSYQIAASGSPASYAATMLPAGLSLDPSTGAITGTPTAVGNTTITLSATNSEGTGSGNLTIRVVPARPEITSATTANGTVGSAFSYQIAASGPPTSYAAKKLPKGLTLNASTGAITGTPMAAGNTTITLSATNSEGIGSGNLTIRVVPARPVITSAITANATMGRVFSYQIKASNVPTTYSIVGSLPIGMTLNSKTGLIRGTPRMTGNTTLTIIASNAGGIGSAELTIRVTPATPILSGAKTVNGKLGSAFSYQIKASNSPTSYAADALPSGLSINASTGVINGTPSAASKTIVTISASNLGGTGFKKIIVNIKK